MLLLWNRCSTGQGNLLVPNVRLTMHNEGNKAKHTRLPSYDWGKIVRRNIASIGLEPGAVDSGMRWLNQADQELEDIAEREEKLKRKLENLNRLGKADAIAACEAKLNELSELREGIEETQALVQRSIDTYYETLSKALSG